MSILVMLLISIVIGTFMAHVTTPRHKWPDYTGYLSRLTTPAITESHVPDYYKIRELEYTLFKRNYHHAGSPVPCNCDICNPPPMCVNSQLCKHPGTHTIREHLPEWDRTPRRGYEPVSRDRTVNVPKGVRYRKIPKSRDIDVWSAQQRMMRAAFGYGSQPWDDRYGE